ncbi:mycothiol synthase [Corynebacterium sp. 11A]|uniref:mycothiol synthase n=1 Tax=Corynebacterium sp. 11A TaxID=2080510 RepID=UPI00124BD9C3|nr:mycothiol synthase [Corynebacterium sp. 11A]
MRYEKLHLPTHAAFRSATLSMLDAVQREDGVAALSEQFLRGLDDAALAHTHWLALDEDTVVGALAVAQDSAELAVHPAYRRRHVATQLLDQAAVTDVWAHGDLPAAQALAQRRHARITRELLVMGIDGDDLREYVRRSTTTPPDPELELVDYAAACARWGEEQVQCAWLEANNSAFSWHPEQGGWDLAQLRSGMDTDWFDPAGVLLYMHRESGQVAGFHWTKSHDAEQGEIYVVGVADGFRGRGLGAPLIAAGVAYLVEQGHNSVILYVEADNAPAVTAYEQAGFSTSERHVVYSSEQSE